MAALNEFFSAFPDPRKAFRLSICKFVDENLGLDQMVKTFGEVGRLLMAGDPAQQKSF